MPISFRKLNPIIHCAVKIEKKTKNTIEKIDDSDVVAIRSKTTCQFHCNIEIVPVYNDTVIKRLYQTSGRYVICIN